MRRIYLNKRQQSAHYLSTCYVYNKRRTWKRLKQNKLKLQVLV